MHTQCTVPCTLKATNIPLPFPPASTDTIPPPPLDSQTPACSSLWSLPLIDVCTITPVTCRRAGALYLSGLVNCPVDCGDFGRCVALNSSSSSSSSSAAGQFGCECECGYSPDPSTGRCEVANGTCPLFGSSSSGSSVVLLSNTSRSGGGSSSDGSGCSGGGDAVAATAGTCPAKYGFDVFSKTCTRCEDGWGGPSCKLCATDEACKVSCEAMEGQLGGGGWVGGGAGLVGAVWGGGGETCRGTASLTSDVTCFDVVHVGTPFDQGGTVVVLACAADSRMLYYVLLLSTSAAATDEASEAGSHL